MVCFVLSGVAVKEQHEDFVHVGIGACLDQRSGGMTVEHGFLQDVAVFFLCAVELVRVGINNWGCLSELGVEIGLWCVCAGVSFFDFLVEFQKFAFTLDCVVVTLGEFKQRSSFERRMMWSLSLISSGWVLLSLTIEVLLSPASSCFGFCFCLVFNDHIVAAGRGGSLEFHVQVLTSSTRRPSRSAIVTTSVIVTSRSGRSLLIAVVDDMWLILTMIFVVDSKSSVVVRERERAKIEECDVMNMLNSKKVDEEWMAFDRMTKIYYEEVHCALEADIGRCGKAMLLLEEGM
eukprot:gene13041-14382_t